MRSCILMLSLLVFVLSCSNQPQETTGNKPGDTQAFITSEPESETRILMYNICAALEEKAHDLDDYIMHRTELSSTYQESDCAGKMSTAQKMNVFIVSKPNRYEFASDTGAFGLPEVETLTSGSMKEICANINSPFLTNPFKTDTRTAIDFRVVKGLSKCITDSQHTCVQIMRGPLNIEGTQYRVNSIALISFEMVRGNRPGFYTYKNEKTFGSCGSSGYRTKIATF